MNSIKWFFFEHKLGAFYYIIIAICILYLIVTLKDLIKYVYMILRFRIKMMKYKSKIEKVHSAWWLVGKRKSYDFYIHTNKKRYAVKMIRTFRKGKEYAIPTMEQWYIQKYLALPTPIGLHILNFGFRKLHRDYFFIKKNEENTIPCLLFYPKAYRISKNIQKYIKSAEKNYELFIGEAHLDVLLLDGRALVHLLEETQIND